MFLITIKKMCVDRYCDICDGSFNVKPLSYLSMLTFLLLTIQTIGGQTTTSAPVAPQTVTPSTPSSPSPATPARANFSQTVGNTSFEMVFVEGGMFMMGCTPEQGGDCDDDEKPSHRVTVSDFYIGKFEVTQGLWKAVMNGNNPSHFKGDNRPVESVSWDDVQVFISRLNSMTGRNYRLPTEAEWEYAARGGSRSRGFKYSGSNNIGEVAWYYENSGDRALNDRDWNDLDAAFSNLERNNNRTRPVGTKKPNELGLYDMTGNVWEWVHDWYGSYTSSAKTDPTGPASGSDSVLRGGGWYSDARGARVSYRSYNRPDNRSFIIGFRLAVSP